ncbi:MAG: beta-lactamase family protein [Firmicutes bacterium]|nr:beta-lactamase family protein [Bacillota bacterium]
MEKKEIDRVITNYVETLYNNQNITDTPHLRGLYSKEEYNDLLEDVVAILKNNPNPDIDQCRSELLQKSGIMELIHEFILDRQLTPGMVVSFGSELNKDTIVCGNKQEVLYQEDHFISAPLPMTENTIFDMASTSKLFTAISILKLCEAGLIDMHEPVRKYEPRFQNLGDITIFDLITFSVPVRSIGRIDAAKTPAEAAMLTFTLTKEEQHDPTFPYTDMGCIALKHVIENVSNMTLRQFIQEEILDKCHMNSTFLNVPQDLIPQVANENYSSIVDSKGNILTRYNNTPGTVHDPKTNALGHRFGIAPGHAGFFSTAQDLQSLASCLVNYELLSKDSTLQLGQNVVGGLVRNNNGELVFNCHHGLLTYVKQADPYYLSIVQPFLSGKSFASPGFAGTSLCVDPINKVSTFIGSTRLHNRIYSVSPTQYDNIVKYDCGLREYISPTGQRKVYSKTFSKDCAAITKATMKLSLQYRLLEQVLGQSKEIKRTYHI